MLFRKIAQALPGINGNSPNDEKSQSKHLIYYLNSYLYINNISQCKKLTSIILIQKQVDVLVKSFIYDKNCHNT